ncbi:MAG: hypothetical protein U1F43_16930 [Myxococcota bacterium]
MRVATLGIIVSAHASLGLGCASNPPPSDARLGSSRTDCVRITIADASSGEALATYPFDASIHGDGEGRTLRWLFDLPGVSGAPTILSEARLVDDGCAWRRVEIALTSIREPADLQAIMAELVLRAQLRHASDGLLAPPVEPLPEAVAMRLQTLVTRSAQAVWDAQADVTLRLMAPVDARPLDVTLARVGADQCAAVPWL